MTIPVLDYDPAEDARRCYDLAIKTKHDRGDDYYLRPALDHVPVEPIQAPNWWLWAAIIFCAVFWAAAIAWWAA